MARPDERRKRLRAARLYLVIEVESARAEDPRREFELSGPVFDGPAAEERLRPGVHLARDLLGDGHEPRVRPAVDVVGSSCTWVGEIS